MFNTAANTPGSELTKRIDALKRLLETSGIEGALILQNADLFYFAGTIQQGYLYIPARGEPQLMVRKNTERARAESSISLIEQVH